MAYIPREKLISTETEGQGLEASSTGLPVNHRRGIWDHIPLVIVASDSLRM